MEQGDHSKRSNRENRTTFSDDPYISGVFQLDEPKKRFHLHSNRNFRNFLANGKQPLTHKLIGVFLCCLRRWTAQPVACAPQWS